MNPFSFKSGIFSPLPKISPIAVFLLILSHSGYFSFSLNECIAVGWLGEMVYSLNKAVFQTFDNYYNFI